MPVVINKGDLKYKDSNGDYQSFNTVAGVDKKSSEIISEIQAEGTTQKNTLISTGKTISDSWPADYSTLTGDVAVLKTSLAGLQFSVSGNVLTITDGTNTWTLG